MYSASTKSSSSAPSSAADGLRSGPTGCLRRGLGSGVIGPHRWNHVCREFARIERAAPFRAQPCDQLSGRHGIRLVTVVPTVVERRFHGNRAYTARAGWGSTGAVSHVWATRVVLSATGRAGENASYPPGNSHWPSSIDPEFQDMVTTPQSRFRTDIGRLRTASP